MKIFIFILFIIFIFTGCVQQNITKINNLSKANLKEVSWNEIHGISEKELNESLDVFKIGCLKKDRFNYLKVACENVNNYNNGIDFFTANFTPYQLYNDKGSKYGLITGYYEPIINGSRKKSSIYKYPIYKTPQDLVSIDLSSIYPELKGYKLKGKMVDGKVVPYDSRKEIYSTTNNNLEPLVYLDSKIDRFILEVQGSGKVKLENGEIINVGYANQNGQKYYSIGKKLIEIGAIKKEEMSLQSIKNWFAKNPNRVDEILELNKSVVFFDEKQEGATGALGVSLIPLKNIAVDTNYIPLGLPVFVNTTNPLTKKEINSLTIAADVGGAIKGEIRADMFFGSSKMAEDIAGNMKQNGELTVFIPKKLLK